MKNSVPLLVLFLLVIFFTSCKTETEKRAEIVTANYVRFVDSVTHKTTADAAANWYNIEKYFEKQSNELNCTIDNLDDISAFDAKIDSATAKYEVFKNSIPRQKKVFKAVHLSAE